jgi:hypothetical protein
VWRSGFTAANTHHTRKPRTVSAGAAIHKALVLTTESIKEFEDTCGGYYEHYQPRGEIESRLVNEIATAWWRARRMLCADTETINAHLAATGHAPER